MSRFPTFLPLHVRLVLTLARAKMLYPLVVCCVIGAAVFVRGIVVETNEMRMLRSPAVAQLTLEVVEANSFEYPSLMDYVGRGLSGKLPRESENVQVTAMAITYAGSMLVILTILIARAAWRMQVRMSPVAGRKMKKKK